MRWGGSAQWRKSQNSSQGSACCNTAVSQQHCIMKPWLLLLDRAIFRKPKSESLQAFTWTGEPEQKAEQKQQEKGSEDKEIHPYVPMVRGIMPCRGIKLSSRPSRPPYRECEIRRSWSSREVLVVWGPSGLPGASCMKRKEAGGIRITFFFTAHFFRLCPGTSAECMESVFGCRQTK